MRRSFRDRHLGRFLGRAGLGVALLAAGALGGAVWTERHARSDSPRTGMLAAGPMTAPSPTGEPADITLTEEAVTRAGIKSVVVEAAVGGGRLTVPGTVTPNAYRETKINAFIGGVTRAVAAELGATVHRGDVLAVIFSSELAEAQMKYLSMAATFEADHLKLERTKDLLRVGANSRRELEEATALHEAHETELAAARQRLLVLGLSSEQIRQLRDASHIVSEVPVRAPAGGTVIVRSVNPGQVVAPGQELFTVTDLETVWIIGEVFEKDFARIAVGAAATIVLPVGSKIERRGRVAYIDPRVDPVTRTAKVRIEVANPGGELRLGMFVNVTLGTSSGPAAIVVPRDAVHAVGGRTVVYVAAADGEPRFVERPVTVGDTVDDRIQILAGVKPGERVVTDGSFLLRAEASRMRSGS